MRSRTTSRLLLLFSFLILPQLAQADSGSVPGLREALIAMMVVVILIVILGSLTISFLTYKVLNARRKKSKKSFLWAFILGLTATLLLLFLETQTDFMSQLIDPKSGGQNILFFVLLIISCIGGSVMGYSFTKNK